MIRALSLAPVRGWIARLARDRGGGVLVEFAMAAPIMVLLLVGGAEAARFFLAQQKIQRTAMTVADLASRTPELSATDIANIFAAAGEVARPHDVPGAGRVVISSLGRDGTGTPEVRWQRADGALSAPSQIGEEGAAATFQPEVLLDDEETVIVAEVFLAYEPAFTDLFPARTFYHRAVFRPRLSREVALLAE